MEAPKVAPSRRRSPRPLTELPPGITPGRAALAAELRRGRDSAQLSQEELAQRVYSSKASVSRWLAGRALPSEKQAIDWARMCGTDEHVMLQLLAAATAESGRPNGPPGDLPAGSAGGGAVATPAQPGPADRQPASRSRRHLSRGAVTVIGVVAVLAIALGIIWPIMAQRHIVQCHEPFPLSLQIPPETGAHVGVTVEAVCAVPAGRTYLVIEKIPDVDPTNPHPVYFVKASIPRLKIGQTSSRDFELKEPVGTSAQFWVVSVDNGGLQALNQNQVVDNGHLFLPSGTIQESSVSWHRKGWQ
jgi:DNA-binding XRE family transcriptional regulator